MPDRIKKAIADVPDFPKKGIVFKDITPVLADAELLNHTIELLADKWKDKAIQYVAGIEARGFIFASAVACRLNAVFIPIRKPGKLPRAVYSESYELEYGTDKLEIHRDAIPENSKVLLIDDLLATGGTAAACLKLLTQCKAKVVGVGFLIDLTFLNGRKKLGDYDISALVSY